MVIKVCLTMLLYPHNFPISQVTFIIFYLKKPEDEEEVKAWVKEDKKDDPYII